MAGSRRKWDGVLNLGGVIGGVASGVVVGVLVFGTAEPGKVPDWAANACIMALMGGAYVGTVVWGRIFRRLDPLVSAVAEMHKQIVQQGAECPRCKVRHSDYRLVSPGKSLDEPCVVCRRCGRSSAPSDFDGVSAL